VVSESTMSQSLHMSYSVAIIDNVDNVDLASTHTHQFMKPYV